MGKLEGKVAIVSGAGQGLGRGVALAFAKEGARVVIAELNPETGAAVAEDIRHLGGQAISVKCDVGIEQQVKQMVDQAVAALGPIDILVNNAQSWGPKNARPAMVPSVPFEDFPEEYWDNTFQTGVKATFYCCKAVFPHMKRRGGKIINVGSRRGLIGYEGSVDYNANKEAIRGLTRTAAREWGKYRINVNVVCPAAETASMAMFRLDYPEQAQALMDLIPLHRFGDPERDLGRAFVFLASEDADFITGQTIMVDGGSYMFP